MRKLSVISIIAILVVAMCVGSCEPVEAQGTEYSLYVNIVGHGVVTYNGSSPFDPGDVVVLTAYPESGWEFAGWSGDLSGTANPQYLTMDSNKSVTVTFTKIPQIPKWLWVIRWIWNLIRCWCWF
jgi:hypothetical protein